MGKSLVIVESPAKARTISRFLGGDFVVESSIGHIRDLPKDASEVPSSIKDKPWGRMGVDVDHDFKPHYVIPSEKKKQVTKLKKLVKEADCVYLATDEDREGESISWHLCEVLNPKVQSKRLVFHEITREAILHALESPRNIDERLVRAQETRRILDRLYGYEVSPVLWKKIAPRLSAGRVQSVSVRIIVDREKARIEFVSANYWDIVGSFDSDTKQGPGFPLAATLISVAGKRVAVGRDFDSLGKLKTSQDDLIVLDETLTRDLAARLSDAAFEVIKVEQRPYTLKPGAPFTTSTLQQEANRKLRLSTRVTMQIAQRLYENGYITYMRTDSTNLADSAVKQVRNLVSELYGNDYLPKTSRSFQTKVKNAQEAHEAIRPAGEHFRRPEEVRTELNADELKLYELIWKRTVACQMESARGHRVTIQIQGEEAVFQATGKTIEFPGFLRAYVEGADDPEAELADKETLLPTLEVGDRLRIEELEPKGHSTQPPPRFTEASLVKELEANGVGRPSTYASIISTILHREYVVKQGNALVPTFTAFAVVELLKKNFTNLVDVNYTARMEDDLDEISRGERKSVPYLKSFYFGDDSPGLKDLLTAEIDPRQSCTIPIGRDEAEREINVRIGRFGPFLERGEDRASVPDGTAPDSLNIALATKLLDSGPRLLGQDPETQEPIYLKSGRYGPYVQLGETVDGNKPKMKSLTRGLDEESVNLETAIQILSLPRSLGTDIETTEEVFADEGRFGPYLKRGSDSRSIPEPENAFTVDLKRAVEIFKTVPKGRSRRGPQVIREVGEDKETGVTVNLMNGRYGPYVTDGTVNASLARNANPDELTLTEALALLKARADRKGTRRRKATSKKKTAKKKTTKKATAKKKAAKKAPGTKKKKKT